MTTSVRPGSSRLSASSDESSDKPPSRKELRGGDDGVSDGKRVDNRGHLDIKQVQEAAQEDDYEPICEGVTKEIDTAIMTLILGSEEMIGNLDRSCTSIGDLMQSYR